MTPEEMVVQWEGIAAKVAARYSSLVPVHAFDDLKQECMIALWKAAKSYDGSTPWKLYALSIVGRRAREWTRKERKGGLKWVGRVEDIPFTYLLGDRDEWVRYNRLHKDDKELEDLLGWLAEQNVNERSVEIVEMVARYDMNQSQVAAELGISRQRVSQLLDPIRLLLLDYLARERGDLKCLRSS